MTEMADILNRLEVEGGFSSRNLEQFRDLSEKPNHTEIEASAQRLTEAYDAAILEGATHNEARKKIYALEKTFRASQAETVQNWMKDNAEIIETGLTGIPSEGLQKTVKSAYGMLVETYPDGHRRFRHDIGQTLLSVTDTYKNKKPSQELSALHSQTKTLIEQTARGKIYDSEALVGKSVQEAFNSGAPLPSYLSSMDTAHITEVTSVGFVPDKLVNNGNQMLTEPLIPAHVEVE